MSPIDDGIARHDIVVVDTDLLWRVEVMNAIDTHEGVDADDGATLLEAAGELDPSRAGVVVVGPTAHDDLRTHLGTLATSHPLVQVLVAVDDPAGPDGPTGRELSAVGVADVVTSGSGTAPVVDAALALLGRARASSASSSRAGTAAGSPASGGQAAPVGTGQDIGRLVVVTAAKGGQGATTLAVNLAAALAGGGTRRVALAEGEPALGDLGLMLGLPVPAIEQDRSVLAAHPERLATYTHHHDPTGLDLVVPPRGPDPLSPLPPELLIATVAESMRAHDFVVLDAPLRVVVESSIAPDASEVLLVTTSGYADLKNALIAAGVLGSAARVGLVLDRVPPRGAPDPDDIRRAVDLPVVATIPRDDRVEGRRPGSEVTVVDEPGCAFSRAVLSLAARVTAGDTG